MWNGVGPGFLKYQRGTFHHIDEMKDLGFEWDYRRGAKPRPTTPGTARRRSRQGRRRRRGRLWLPDDQRHDRRYADARLGRQGLQRLGGRFRQAGRSQPGLSVGDRPEHRSDRAAAEVRRCAKLGLRGGDLAFKRMTPPLGTMTGMRCGRPRPSADSRSRSTPPASRRCARPTRRSMEKKYSTQYRLVRSALFQLDTMEVLVSLLASGACERYPDFNFVLGESGVTWLPYVFDRLDTEYDDRARSLGFQDETQRLLPPPGLCHLSAGQVSGADHPADRRGQHHVGLGLSASGLHVAGLTRHARPRTSPRSRPAYAARSPAKT